MPSFKRGTVTWLLKHGRKAAGFAPVGQRGSEVVLDTLGPPQSRSFPPQFKTKAQEARGHSNGTSTDRGTAKTLHACPCGTVESSWWHRVGVLCRNFLDAGISTLTTEGWLTPACCSTSAWTELHHVLLQTVNSCIIACFVHRGAVVNFDTGLGQVCSQQWGRSGAEMLWVGSCCYPGH